MFDLEFDNSTRADDEMFDLELDNSTRAAGVQGRGYAEVVFIET